MLGPGHGSRAEKARKPHQRKAADHDFQAHTPLSCGLGPPLRPPPEFNLALPRSGFRRPGLDGPPVSASPQLFLISIRRSALTASGFLAAVSLSTPLSNLASTLVSSTTSGRRSER
jgi:hypothetical protein